MKALLPGVHFKSYNVIIKSYTKFESWDIK